MVVCAKCKKRIAVVFVTKLENGKKVTEGICMKCARELGVPLDNMMGDMMNQLGLTPEQLDGMSEDLAGMLAETPSENDDNEDGGAPAIDFPTLFRESGLIPDDSGENKPAERPRK